MQLKKIDGLMLFLLILVGLWGIKALFHPGFYTSHDGEHQIIRLNHFLIGLADGQFPVRWAGLPAFNGFGYPLFVFTYRLPFYLAAVFKAAGFSLVDAVKAVFILTYLLSGVIMYWAQKKIWRSDLAAFVGTIFYLWAPWRFSTILVRASLGEAVGFLFFPLILWAIWQRRSILGALALAGLLLSHGLLAFLFLPFLAALMVFLVWQSRERRTLIRNYLGILAGGAGLAAYSWLPALVEKSGTAFAAILGGFYRQHFVTLGQLFYSPWGYGLSNPGVDQDAMSFQVGLAQWLVVFLMMGLLFGQLVRRKKFDLAEKLASLLIIFFFLTIFLMTALSDFYWQAMAGLLTVDFPFRYLALSVLLASLLAGAVVVELRKIKLPKLCLYPLILSLLLLVFYGNRNYLRVNLYLDWPDAYYQNLASSSTSFDEYRPKGVILKFLPPRTAPVTGPVKIKILSQEISSDFQKFLLETDGDAQLQAGTIYYPGWQLLIDGQKSAITVGRPTGLIEFWLPAGRHEVSLKFEKTPDRILAEAVSLFFGGWACLGASRVIFNLLKAWQKDRR